MEYKRIERTIICLFQEHKHIQTQMKVNTSIPKEFESIENTKKINIQRIVERTKGYSGAELKATCVESGMIAIRDGRTSVTQSDVMDAVVRLDKKRGQGSTVRSPEALYS